MKILELADSKEDLDWYSRDILVDAAARNDWELLNFLLEKKPKHFQFELYENVCKRGLR
jgi:hypothetical protein